MIIGITGATGFLGKAIIDQWVGEPSKKRSVIGWTRSPKRQPARASVVWCRGQLRDSESVQAMASQCDAIVHAGVHMRGDSFIGGEGDPATYFDANVTGTVELLEAAVQHDVKKFVFISSGAVHAKVADDRRLDERHPLWPSSLYGAYKASVETIVHAYGLSGKIDACSLRPTSIYGREDPPSESKFFPLIQDVAMGKTVEATGGGKIVHARDVAKAVGILLTADSSMTAGQTFNCTDRFVSHHEVATIAKEITGSEATIRGEPKPPGNVMDTSKIQHLGMSFGGTALLRSTVEELVSQIS
jgi:nucleoside-diphosphate-sugar epimerase